MRKPGSYWTANGPLWCRASNWIANKLVRLAEAITDLSYHFARCPDCGRSRYYGKSCK